MLRTLSCTLLILLQALPALAAKTTFTPRFTATGEYTDNVYRTQDKKEEFTATFSPGATLDITGRKAGLFLSYDPTYTMYKENSGDDLWRQYLNLSGWWDLSRKTSLSISDSLTISDNPADDPVDQSGTRRGRSKYFRNTATINLNHRFGSSDSLTLGYRHNTLTNDDSFYENNTYYEPYAGVTWWFVPSKWGLDLNASFTRGEFERSDDFDSWLGRGKIRRRINRRFDVFLEYGYIDTEYTGETESYYFHDLGVGFDYVVGEHINTSFTLSYLRRVLEFTGKEDDFFVSWDIDAKWPLRKGSIGLRGSSGYTQDQFAAGGRGFSLYSGLIGDIDWQFTRTLGGDVFASYRYNRYIDFDPEYDDHILEAGPGLTWQAMWWMQFRLEYTYTQLFSDIEATEYDENRVFLSVVFSARKPVAISD